MWRITKTCLTTSGQLKREFEKNETDWWSPDAESRILRTWNEGRLVKDAIWSREGVNQWFFYTFDDWCSLTAVCKNFPWVLYYCGNLSADDRKWSWTTAWWHEVPVDGGNWTLLGKSNGWWIPGRLCIMLLPHEESVKGRMKNPASQPLRTEWMAFDCFRM